MIDSIQIVEVPNYLYEIGKNSFVLINSYIFERNNIDILDTLEILNKENISMLGIMSNEPHFVEDISKKINFPITAYSNALNYKDILKEIPTNLNEDEILLEQMSVNLNALKNSPFFTIDNILNLLISYVNNPIVLISKDFEMINYLKPQWDCKKRIIPTDIINKLLTSNMNNKYSFSNQTILHDEEYYTLYPLKIPQKTLGYLCFIYNDKNRNDNFNNKIANIIIPHIIINMLTYHKGQVMYEKSKEQFIRSLLYGLYPDKKFIKAESENFQFKYIQKIYIWILQISPLNNDTNDYSIQNIVPNKILNKVINIAQSRYPDDYNIIDGNGLIFIHEKDDTPDYILNKKSSDLVKHLEIYLPEYKFAMGISRAYDSIEKLNSAYEDAVFSLKIGSNIFKDTKNIYPYNDLILYHFLYSAKDNPIIERIYDITTRKIIDYDIKNKTKLFETLDVLIHNNFNMTEASENLFVHRNTLYNRLEKIEEATGYDLNNSQSRLLLHLGMKIHDIYDLSK